MNIFRSLMLITPLMLQGCAWWNTAHYTDDIDSPAILSVDAKQRTILATTDPNDRSASGDKRIVYCAEPSPDALSSFTSNLDVEANKKDLVSAVIKGSFGESAASLGIRTESIQLMRDAMFRSCEAYIAGALSAADYAALQHTYQKSMVTLLAIEQMTSAVRPGQVILNAGGSVSATQDPGKMAETLASLSKELSDAKLKEEAKREELKTAKSKLLDALGKGVMLNGKKVETSDQATQYCDQSSQAENTKCADYLTINAAYKSLKDSFTAAEITLNTVLKSISNGTTVSSNANGSVVNYNVPPNSAAPAVSIEIAKEIGSLVSMVYLDDMLSSCKRKKAEAASAVSFYNSGKTELAKKGTVSTDDIKKLNKVPSTWKGFIPLTTLPDSTDLQVITSSIDKNIEAAELLSAEEERICTTLINAYADRLAARKSQADQAQKPNDDK